MIRCIFPSARVCIEDLQIRNRSKPSKGNTEKRVGAGLKSACTAHKPSLNRAILDQSWGEFCRQLDDTQGGALHNTRRMCLACGYMPRESRKTQAKFECAECGYDNNADLVGASNVLALGAPSSHDAVSPTERVKVNLPPPLLAIASSFLIQPLFAISLNAVI
jgi:transposase